jgi:CBS domain-containing protein
MSAEEPADEIECGIGVREILAGDGRVRRRLTVHCDPQREAVYVATCSVCHRCVGVRPPAPGEVGVVLCRRVSGDEPVDHAPGDPATPVRAVMERNVVCVAADVAVDTAAALLVELGASGVPVVDDDGHPIGMVSLADCLRARREGGAGDGAGRTVADVMTPMVFSVVESTELGRAAELLASGGFHQLPVVMGDGTVGGVISTQDLARWIARMDRAAT